ncbi:MAG: IclR family transcriptional regulator [Rubrivivax sp.]
MAKDVQSTSISETSVGLTGSLSRALSILRALAMTAGEGGRVTHLARATGLKPATAHRLLKALVAEGLVEQDASSRVYRLGIELFVLGASAGRVLDLRTLCRPALLRLCASLGDTIFLLVRSGFDAVCLDRVEGPFPIRTFTGDVGGRIPLGLGQGSLAILAFLPEAERDEVIRFNAARMREYGALDEVFLRAEIGRTREQGHCSRVFGLNEGMAGLAVPILDREGHAIAALSVGTLTERLNADRAPIAAEMLKREAAAVAPKINPFDITLRRPSQILAGRFDQAAGPPHAS